MKLYIKYMVSLRCKMIVKEEFSRLGVPYTFVDHGIIRTPIDVTAAHRQQLKTRLERSGLDLLNDEMGVLLEKLTRTITELITTNHESREVNFRAEIPNLLGMDYDYLSTLFSQVKGVSIEQFIIATKVEYAKELFLYRNMSMEEITTLLHYKSIAELTYQFTRITGLKPSFFQELKQKRADLRNQMKSDLPSQLPPNFRPS